jgi:hypothetical protein
MSIFLLIAAQLVRGDAMTKVTVIKTLRIGAMAFAAGLALSTVSFAQGHAVGGGVGHGGSIGGVYGGRGSFAGHSAFAYGHYGYGRLGYDHFGNGSVEFYDGLGVVGYGLFLDTLALYYSTYWWGDVPYSNESLYNWNPSMGQYETALLPQSFASELATTQAPENVSLFVYPRNWQTPSQEATDRLECQNWATGQTGLEFPPADDTATVGISSPKRQDYARAQSACLGGRGYSVQ